MWYHKIKYAFDRICIYMEVRDTDTVTFAICGSNDLYKIELARSLLHFAEFDFTYFWEQSIEAGRNARKTGRISSNLRNLAIGAAAKCHPYVEASINTEFSSLVTDCIIAYICHSEGIGLEELWARCISPKSLYEKDIFYRVSEYKTGRGINQWINIVRMQEYARSKMKFIYETERNAMLSPTEYRTRREYFDLAFSVAANETGCDMTEMPSFKKYTPSTLPDSVFMMGKVSKNIYRSLSEKLSSAQVAHERKLCDHNRDQTALDAFSFVKDMELPPLSEMNSALEAFHRLPREIYIPNSFKAAIDLEFLCMDENGIYLAKCPHCGRFFVREISEKSPYCNRVNSSGMTCSEQVAEELNIAFMKNAEEIPPQNSEEPVSHENTENIAQETAPAAENAQETEPLQETQKPIQHKVPIEIPKNIEKRCQRVYNLLYKRIGIIISPEDFSEWAKYLSDMKSNLREGNADISQIEEFLDYWEEVIERRGRSGRHRREDAELNKPKKNTPEENLNELFNEAVRQAEERERQAAAAEALKAEKPQSVEERAEEGAAAEPVFEDYVPPKLDPEEVAQKQAEKKVKPFSPPKYNTVLEAMLDGKYRSDEILSESVNGDGEDITVNGRKVSIPNWERVPRD